MLRLLVLILTRCSTAVAGRSSGAAGFATMLNGQARQINGLALQQTTYVIDPTTGDCTFILGDIRYAPSGSYSDSPTMVATGLPAGGKPIYGAASKSTGSWVQL